jgi:3-oxoacid CoA-transferase subunit B
VKERLDDQTVALRLAREIQDGWYVNLGFGIPTLVANFVPEGKDVFFVSENGLLGFGPITTKEEAAIMGWKYVDASAQPVSKAPGMAIVDYAEAFNIIRAGRLDLTVLGGLQVSEKGDLANWRLPIYKGRGGTIGGAMDLAACCKRVFVAMTHTEKNGKPKIVRNCIYPITALQCVDLIFTDLCVIEITNLGLVLREVAPGWSPTEVQALTEAPLIIPDDVLEIQL